MHEQPFGAARKFMQALPFLVSFQVKSFMNRATQSVESLELRVDEVASKAVVT